MDKKKCPVCDVDMEYNPSKFWTGLRYIITNHVWVCCDETHAVRLFERPTDEERGL